MNPKFEALAYRIWASANPRGWDCLMSDVARDIDVPVRVISAACAVKGWSNRFRVAKRENTAHSGAAIPRTVVIDAVGYLTDIPNAEY